MADLALSVCSGGWPGHQPQQPHLHVSLLLILSLLHLVLFRCLCVTLMSQSLPVSAQYLRLFSSFNSESFLTLSTCSWCHRLRRLVAVVHTEAAVAPPLPLWKNQSFLKRTATSQQTLEGCHQHQLQISGIRWNTERLLRSDVLT